MITGPSGKPFRMLKKKDIFAEVGFALALKTDGTHQTRNKAKGFFLYTVGGMCAQVHILLAVLDSVLESETERPLH